MSGFAQPSRLRRSFHFRAGEGALADILIFGNINADRVIRVDGPVGPGLDITGEDLGIRLGGAGANTGSALLAAGHHVRLVGFVGTDPDAARLRRILARHSWDVSHVGTVDGGTPTCIILIESNGDRTIVGFRRKAAPPQWPAVSFDGAACIYVGSRWPLPGGLLDRIRAAGIPVVCQLSKTTVVPSARIVVASEEELSQAEAADPWGAVRGRGLEPEWVVVTRGKRGAMATNGETCLAVPAVPAQVVDTTGAGDAFAAGLVHGAALGVPMGDALSLAARWAARAVSHFGSTFPVD